MFLTSSLLFATFSLLHTFRDTQARSAGNKHSNTLHEGCEPKVGFWLILFVSFLFAAQSHRQLFIARCYFHFSVRAGDKFRYTSRMCKFSSPWCICTTPDGLCVEAKEEIVSHLIALRNPVSGASYFLKWKKALLFADIYHNRWQI